MQEMLCALDHRRALGLLGDVDDAFHPQEVRSEILLQGVEQQPQRFARDRLVADEAERGNVAVVQMVMIVVVMIVMRVIVLVDVLVGGGVEPGACVGFGIAGVEPFPRNRPPTVKADRRCARSLPPG